MPTKSSAAQWSGSTLLRVVALLACFASTAGTAAAIPGGVLLNSQASLASNTLDADNKIGVVERHLRSNTIAQPSTDPSEERFGETIQSIANDFQYVIGSIGKLEGVKAMLNTVKFQTSLEWLDKNLDLNALLEAARNMHPLDFEDYASYFIMKHFSDEETAKSLLEELNSKYGMKRSADKIFKIFFDGIWNTKSEKEVFNLLMPKKPNSKVFLTPAFVQWAKFVTLKNKNKVHGATIARDILHNQYGEGFLPNALAEVEKDKDYDNDLVTELQKLPKEDLAKG